ncbi:MAG: PEP-CTERM sorting domain-containing protein [Anaerohalosphaera sp.]|nr:PEP-CTERM sorting domain-containing protein [Anaerohalosphaera sp.]
MPKKVMTAILLLFCSVSLCRADVLIDFDFTGLPGNDLLPLTATDTIADHVVLADLGLGAGGTVGVSGSNATTGEFNWWMFNDADNPGSGWMTCTLEAEAGYALDLSSVTISVWRNGAGAPEEMRYLASTDGVNFVQVGGISQQIQAGLEDPIVFYDHTFDLSSLGDVASVELRFSPLPGTAVSHGWGNLHINDLVIEGAVVPEPVTLVLLGMGGLLSLRRRR